MLIEMNDLRCTINDFLNPQFVHRKSEIVNQ